MNKNEEDPLLFKIPIYYKTGHKEYIIVDDNYYDPEDHVRIINRQTDCEFIKDDLNFYYSGKVEVADQEGLLKKDIPEFQRMHKSVEDFIKYVANTDILKVDKRDTKLSVYRLISHNTIDIHSYCITRSTDFKYYNKIEIGYHAVKKNLENIKYIDMIPIIFFMQSFGRWLYNIDKKLDAQAVYDTFLKDYRLMYPDGDCIDTRQMINNIEAFETVYNGFCNYGRHKQDKEIEEAEKQLALLKQKKYSNTVAGFGL